MILLKKKKIYIYYFVHIVLNSRVPSKKINKLYNRVHLLRKLPIKINFVESKLELTSYYRSICTTLPRTLPRLDKIQTRFKSETRTLLIPSHLSLFISLTLSLLQAPTLELVQALQLFHTFLLHNTHTLSLSLTHSRSTNQALFSHTLVQQIKL